MCEPRPAINMHRLMPHNGTLGDDAAKAALVSLASKIRPMVADMHDICLKKGWDKAAGFYRDTYQAMPFSKAHLDE